MRKLPDVRVRFDVRPQTRATVGNGHPDTSDTTRARACVCVEDLQRHLLYKTTTPTTPLNNVRVSVPYSPAGLRSDILPDTCSPRCPFLVVMRVYPPDIRFWSQA